MNCNDFLRRARARIAQNYKALQCIYFNTNACHCGHVYYIIGYSSSRKAHAERGYQYADRSYHSADDNNSHSRVLFSPAVSLL